MSKLTYIIAQVEKALKENIAPIPEVPLEAGLPFVAPKDCPMFSEEIMQKLHDFRDKAIAVEDFETWMIFLEIITTKLGLNPASDFGKIASVLNRFRVEEGKNPL